MAAASRSSTFLFQRGFMDYHADRFEDCSFLAYKDSRLMALLPANISDDGILHSHAGLSYGGWLLPQRHLDGADLLEIFQTAIAEWRKMGIKALDYKPLPFIYAAQPSQEDRYALFRLGAELQECNLSAAINLRSPGGYNQQQRRHLAKASKLGAVLRELSISEIDDFMKLLEECLRERHGVAPVHTAEEMHLLAERFPNNIRFHAAILSGKIQAAVCVFRSRRVAHAQYIATSPEGRQLNLLAPLFDFLIENVYNDCEYFDFGISNEDHGLYLNAGLLRQKYSYGATGVAYERYLLEIS